MQECRFSFCDAEHPSSTEVATKKRKSAYHCCVPKCNGDSRYSPSLRFHHIPGREKNKKLRTQWLVKIRRDEGLDFKVVFKFYSYLGMYVVTMLWGPDTGQEVVIQMSI